MPSFTAGRGRTCSSSACRGKYDNRRVKLGLTEDNRVVVLEGVFPGDQVVIIGNALPGPLPATIQGACRRHRAEAVPAAEQADVGVISVAHGTIELPTDQQTLATPLVEGRVSRILVQPSQQVSAGDVLAEVESLQLRTVQLDLLQTLTEVRLAEQSLQRLEGLNWQNVMPKRPLWELQNNLDTRRLKADGLNANWPLWAWNPPLSKAGADRPHTARVSGGVRADGTGASSPGGPYRELQCGARSGGASRRGVVRDP